MSLKHWVVKPKLELNSKQVFVGSSKDVNIYSYIGNLAEDATRKEAEVRLNLEKEQVVAIVGKRGSGKSFTLGVIAESLAVKEEKTKIGGKSSNKAAILFDPLDIYWTTTLPVKDSDNATVAANYKLAKLKNLTGLSFNTKVIIPGSQNKRPTDPDWFNTLEISVTELSDNDWELLLDSNINTDPVSQLVLEAIRLVSTIGYTLQNDQTVQAKPNYSIDDLVDAADSRDLEGFFQPQTIRAAKRKLIALNRIGLFTTESTPITNVIKPNMLTIVMLNRLPESYRQVLMALIIRKIIDSRSKASFIEKRIVFDSNLTNDEKEEFKNNLAEEVPKTTILIDEVQNFADPSSKSEVKEVLIKLVKEGRNSGLSVIIATQQPSAIDKKILSQVETFIAHKLVTESDIRSLGENLKSQIFEVAKHGGHDMGFPALIRNLGQGQCLISSSESNLSYNRTMIIQIRPRATVHGGAEV